MNAVMNVVIAATVSSLLVSGSGFAQSRSAVQFYDSTGATPTAKFGWEGDATNGTFFVETPGDAEPVKVQQGNVTVDGSVTAGSFVGDGSGLTNVSSLGENTVTANKIADGAVTDAKIDSVSWSKIKGMPAGFADGTDDVGSGGTAGVTSITAGEGLNVDVGSGDVTVDVDYGFVAQKSHSHPLAEVTGLSTSLNAKIDKSGGTFTGPISVTAPSSQASIELNNSQGSPIMQLSSNGPTSRAYFFYNYTGTSDTAEFMFFAGTPTEPATESITRIRAHKGDASAQLFHNGTDGYVASSHGDLILKSESGTIGVNGIISHISDQRLKKNIRPITNALDKVLKMDGVKYEFIDDPPQHRSLPSNTQIGLVAQDVESILPEAVQCDSKGYRSIAYSNLVAVLIEAIKEQQTIIKHQAQSIEEQTKKLSNQTCTIDELTKNIAELTIRVSSLDGVALAK